MTLTDAEAERLIKLYAKAEKDILAATNKALLKGNSTRNLDAMIVRVRQIRKSLLSGAREWCDAAIPTAYEAGMEGTGLTAIAGNGEIHQQAMKILADNVYGRFEQVDQVVGRSVADIYRSVALENLTGDVSGYETWKQTAQNIRSNLADKGITGFKDAAGRNWDMETYSEMVARTSTRETMLTGTKNRLLEYDIDLVEIVGGSSEKTCKACQRWDGRVVSLTGKTKGYPTLQEAKDDNFLHPNCTHSYVAASDEVIAKADEENK
jgi:hypothetical protein